MKLKKIIINKYKNLENLEIDLSKKNIFTILGKNNEGKTNVLEAILFWQELFSYDLKKRGNNVVRENEKLKTKITFIFDLSEIVEEDEKIYFEKYFKQKEMEDEKEKKAFSKKIKNIISELKNPSDFIVSIIWDEKKNNFVKNYSENLIRDGRNFKNINFKNLDLFFPKIKKINLVTDDDFGFASDIYFFRDIIKEKNGFFKRVLSNIKENDFFNEMDKISSPNDKFIKLKLISKKISDFFFLLESILIIV